MLTFSPKNISSRFDRMPMAMMTISLIAGILVAAHFKVDSLVLVAIVGLSTLLSFWRENFILLAIFAVGALVYNIRSYDILPEGQDVELGIKISDSGINYGRFSTFDAEVFRYNNQYCTARVRVTADSLTVLQRGDILFVHAPIRPFTPTDGGYARSMQKQGYSGRVTINENRVSEWQVSRRNSLHQWAVSKLKTLLPQSDSRDVAISLSLGAKLAGQSKIKQSYSYSGVSHLLAVSGLHVGMVAMLLTILLLPLSLVWRGNIIRSVLIVALIWLYVALCGYPTSAIRAAIMFSVLQLSHLTRNRYSQENSISTAAFIMLAFRPTMLFELSFCLSFIAVLAIVFVYKPFSAIFYCRSRIVRECVNTIMLSIICVYATAPLISNSFGIISLLSIILTPPALITAQIIIISSLLALIAPLPLARILFSAAEWCADIQNRVIEWAVSGGYGYVEYRIDENTMMIIYLVMVVLLLLGFGLKYTPPQEKME